MFLTMSVSIEFGVVGRDDPNRTGHLFLHLLLPRYLIGELCMCGDNHRTVPVLRILSCCPDSISIRQLRRRGL